LNFQVNSDEAIQKYNAIYAADNDKSLLLNKLGMNDKNYLAIKDNVFKNSSVNMNKIENIESVKNLNISHETTNVDIYNNFSHKNHISTKSQVSL
jgi:hypothetical protein